MWGVEWNKLGASEPSLPLCGWGLWASSRSLRNRSSQGQRDQWLSTPLYLRTTPGRLFKKNRNKHRCPDLISMVSYWLGPGVGPGQPHFLKIPPGDPDSAWLETHNQKWSVRSLYYMKEHRPRGPADVGIPLDHWLGTSPSWRGPVFQVFNFLSQQRGDGGVVPPALKTGSGSGGVLGRSPNGASCVVNWGKVWVALGP